MSLEACEMAGNLLSECRPAKDAVVEACSSIEDNPKYVSVGYGGLPDRTGHVTLDAGFMDGDTLSYGSVGFLEGYRSPVRMARDLSEKEYNNCLVGKGAEAYAELHGYEKWNNLTESSYQRYKSANLKEPKVYDGHDTVCFLAKDQFGSLATAVSTSGLFLKEPGRLGDSPLVGCGFYADSTVGAAAATGVGEDISKGVLSYRAVMLLEQGVPAGKAAQRAVEDCSKRLAHARAMSLIVIDKEGNYGVGTNVPFAYTVKEGDQPVALYYACIKNGQLVHERITNPNTISID